MKKSFLIILTVVWCAMAFQSRALAQGSFPTKPLTIWVGFPPGGSTDVITRVLAETSEKSFGQKIVVVSKPGAGGTVAASQIAREKPDGYTLVISGDSPITRSPHLQNLVYNPLQDFTFIVRVGQWKNVFVVRADSPFKKWEDLVDWAKRNPGQLVHGHPGSGSAAHLAMVQVAKKEGFSYKNVPFLGDTPNINALLGGHVMVASGSSMAGRATCEAKTLRVLIVIDKEGIEYAPDAPTFETMGYEFQMAVGVIIYGPKGISDPIRGILEKTFLDGIKSETFKELTVKQGLSSNNPLTGTPLLNYLQKWNGLYEQYIKEAGLYKTDKKK